MNDWPVTGLNPGHSTLVLVGRSQLFLLDLGSKPSKHKLLTPHPTPTPTPLKNGIQFQGDRGLNFFLRSCNSAATIRDSLEI